jgi:hypothetical protein
MVLRVQRERQTDAFFPSMREYAVHYGLHLDHLSLAAPDAIVMHPGPMNRGIEISSEIADGGRSLILDQVANGVAVRWRFCTCCRGGWSRETGDRGKRIRVARRRWGAWAHTTSEKRKSRVTNASLDQNGYVIDPSRELTRGRISLSKTAASSA